MQEAHCRWNTTTTNDHNAVPALLHVSCATLACITSNAVVQLGTAERLLLLQDVVVLHSCEQFLYALWRVVFERKAADQRPACRAAAAANTAHNTLRLRDARKSSLAATLQDAPCNQP